MALATVNRLPDSLPGRQRRTSAVDVAFWVWLAVSAGILTWLGRGLWAPVDDWMLTGPRSWSDPGSLLRHHNQHLSILPVLIYKALFEVVGFTSYLPFRILSVGVHLLLVVQLRRIMLLAAVSPVVATVVAGSFTMFNAGRISVAQFQMPLGMVFALGAFILMARPCPRRQSLAVAALLCICAIATSGVAVPVVMAVAWVAWRRHGPLRAALAAAPAGVVYLAWWFWERPAAPMAGEWEPSIGGLVVWLFQYFAGAVLGLAGNVVVLAVGLVIGLLTGLVTILVRRPRATHTLEPFALFGAGALLSWFTYLARGGIDAPLQIRYSYLMAALILPLVAVAWMGLIAHRGWLAWLICVPLIIAIPINAVHMERALVFDRAVLQNAKSVVMAMLGSPAAASTPQSTLVWWSQPFVGIGRTQWGYLWAARDRGLLDVSGRDVAPDIAAKALIRLRITQLDSPARGECTQHTRPLTLTVATGTRLGFRGGRNEGGSGVRPGGITVALAPFAALLAAAAEYDAGAEGGTLEVLGADPVTGRPLTVTIASADAGAPYFLCG